MFSLLKTKGLHIDCETHINQSSDCSFLATKFAPVLHISKDVVFQYNSSGAINQESSPNTISRKQPQFYHHYIAILLSNNNITRNELDNVL